MPEYLEYRCCMCPQVNSPSLICPAMVGVQQPGHCHCRFVRGYLDERGRKYYVCRGKPQDHFKPFYLNPRGKGGMHSSRTFGCRNTFDEAQADLNKMAKERGWREVG